MRGGGKAAGEAKKYKKNLLENAKNSNPRREKKAVGEAKKRMEDVTLRERGSKSTPGALEEAILRSFSLRDQPRRPDAQIRPRTPQKRPQHLRRKSKTN